MTRCDDSTLTAYVDGALPPGEAARLRDHLAGCPRCEAVARDHREIKRRLVRHAAAVAVPLGYETRIVQALDAALRVPPRPWWKGPGGLALGVVTLVTSLGLWYRVPRPQPVDIQAVAWQHRHAMNPPAGLSFFTNDRAAARRWVRIRTGDDPRAPGIALPLRAVGACHIGDAPSVVWMYDAQAPVSLIEIGRSESLPDWPAQRVRGLEVRWGVAGGYNAGIWKSEGRTYVFVSSLPRERLRSLLEPGP